MYNFNLTINQAVRNAEVLHHRGAIFTTDKEGNLDYIYDINIIGRLYNFIKSLIDGTSEHKVNKAILATFETITQYAKNNPDKPVWTYPVEQHGKDFHIGFDKVAMRVLLDESRFSCAYYRSPEKQSDDTEIKIRNLAYEVLLNATEQRKKAGIGFDCDHLN